MYNTYIYIYTYIYTYIIHTYTHIHIYIYIHIYIHGWEHAWLSDPGNLQKTQVGISTAIDSMTRGVEAALNSRSVINDSMTGAAITDTEH